jgi:hypothetical protein
MHPCYLKMLNYVTLKFEFKMTIRTVVVLLLTLAVSAHCRNIYGLYVDGNQIKNGDGQVMHWRVNRK